ncbi:hypothetical protein SS50377_27383 [Spironucleus salmonicida]|uniref:Uncharacterized protein n=1 Tax=Spironucleus salmonicida TaxID=348837 RepID=V6LFP3_9EUKA|nr:hypothetical protein SS50377_27383 [Spironucleus salmonicida]|eukprot:EST43317.1 hypothetical protein SS50377_16991 [Spironucleus salmonicida]
MTLHIDYINQISANTQSLLTNIQQSQKDIQNFTNFFKLLTSISQLILEIKQAVENYTEIQLIIPLHTLNSILLSLDLEQNSDFTYPLIAQAFAQLKLAQISSVFQNKCQIALQLHPQDILLLTKIFFSSAFGDLKSAQKIEIFAPEFLRFFQIPDVIATAGLAISEIEALFQLPGLEISLSDVQFLAAFVEISAQKFVTAPFAQIRARTQVRPTDGRLVFSEIGRHFSSISALNAFATPAPQPVFTPQSALFGLSLNTPLLEFLQQIPPSAEPLNSGVLTPNLAANSPNSQFSGLLGRPIFGQNLADLELKTPLLTLLQALDGAQNAPPAFKNDMQPPPSNAVKTANAANFVIQRYIKREALKVFQQAVKSNPSKQNCAKMGKAVQQVKDQFIELVVGNLVKFRHQEFKNCRSEIFRVAEISNEGFLRDEESGEDVFKFVGNCVCQLIGIATQGAFMSYSALDKQIATVFQVIEPFGGSGSRNLYQYLNVLIGEFKAHEPLVLSVKAAQKALIDIINAKNGICSDQMHEINKIRNLPSSNLPKSFVSSLYYFQYNNINIQNIYQQYTKFAQQFDTNLTFQLTLLQQIPQLLNMQFALSELLKFNQQKPSQIAPNNAFSADFQAFAHAFPAPRAPAALVLGFEGSGGTNLTSNLTFSLSFRTAKIAELLNSESQTFSAQNLPRQPISEPWTFDTSPNAGSQAQAINVIQKDDDVVSVGSWLSMDSANLTQSALDSQHEKEATDAILNQFLRQIKGVEMVGNDGKQITEKCDFAVEKGVENAKFELKGSGKYEDLLAQIPQQLYARHAPFLLNFRGQQMPEITEKQLIPRVKFVRLEGLKTPFGLAKTINLLPFRDSANLTISDAPIRFFGVLENAKEKERISKIKVNSENQKLKIDALNERLQRSTQALGALYLQLRDVLQKSNLAANYLQPQTALFQQLLKSKHLDEKAARELCALMKNQAETAVLEAEKAQKTVSEYQAQFAHLKIGGQVTADLEQKFNSSVAQFRQQIAYFSGVSSFILQEKQLVDGLVERHQEQLGFVRELGILAQVQEQYRAQLEKLMIPQLVQEQYRALFAAQDVVIFVYDCTGSQIITAEMIDFLGQKKHGLVVCNKIDLYDRYGSFRVVQENVYASQKLGWEHYFVSCHTGQFMNILRCGIVDLINKACNIGFEGQVYTGKK